MKRKQTAIAVALWILSLLPVPVLASDSLIPGGQIVALELQDDTVTVAAFDDILGENARNAGLQVGDEILAVDHLPVHSATDIREALANCEGEISLTVLRGSQKHTLQMIPCRTEGSAKLGVYLRQGVAGIGTVTFYDPESGIFGALGHGVTDSGGTLLRLTQGHADRAKIQSVKRGLSGKPGQLRGIPLTDFLGTLYRNMPQGVFGVMQSPLRDACVPIAAYSEITTGPAVIRSTVDDRGVQEYSVEILKIYPQDRTDCRHFLLKVTDPDLIAATGGIVQ